MYERKLNIDYGLIQGCYWLMESVFIAFITPILQERGFTHAQIGVLLGIRSVATIFSQSFVSNLADRYADRIPLKVITAMAALTAAFSNMIFLFVPMRFEFTVVLFFVIGAATYCLSPLIDAVAMEFMKQGRGLHYTGCRSVGSITWALASVGLGILMVRFGANSLLAVQILFLFILCGLLMRIETAGRPRTSPDGSKDGGQPHSIVSLLKDYKCYTAFLIAYTLFYMSSTMCTNFQIDVITRLGGNSASLGWAEFLLAVSEVPVVFLYHRCRNRLGLDKLLILTFMFGTLKVFCQSFAPNLACFMLAQVLQMVGWGMSYTAVVQFVMEAVPSADLVKGQGLLAAAGAGVGSSLASYVSGILYDAFGLDVLSGVGTLTGVLGVLVLTAALRIPRPDEAPTYTTKKKEIEV